VKTNAPFQLTPQASEDLDAIWWRIAEDSRNAAERVDLEILATCHRLAKHPRIGTKRQDITAAGALLDGHEVPQIMSTSTVPKPPPCRWSPFRTEGEI
jgi:plasmid stabilization system protein ParE